VGVSEAFLRAKSAKSQLETSKEMLEKRLARWVNSPRVHGQLFIMIVDIISKFYEQCVWF
jgi:hypothetical protein